MFWAQTTFRHFNPNSETSSLFKDASEIASWLKLVCREYILEGTGSPPVQVWVAGDPLPKFEAIFGKDLGAALDSRNRSAPLDIFSLTAEPSRSRSTIRLNSCWSPQPFNPNKSEDQAAMNPNREELLFHGALAILSRSIFKTLSQRRHQLFSGGVGGLRSACCICATNK